MKDTGSGPGKDEAIGRRFQEETKYTPGSLGGYALDWERMPEPYKAYASPLARIPLPEPLVRENTPLWETFARRRSTRAYARALTLPLGVLASLLWATQGITAEGGGWQFRAAPSAGGLYPIETYVATRAVEGLEQGIYHFRPQAFDLELIKRGDYAFALSEAALGQGMIGDAQVTFVWTAIVERSTWKYRQRAYRYIYMDAGHIAQNLYLAGTAAGLGVCAVGAFFDDRVNGLIEVDGTEETALYLACAGRPVAEGTAG